MIFRILAVLLIAGMYIVIPATSLAATAQVIVITASPLVGEHCVTDLVMEFTLPDEVSFSWTPAEEGNATKIVMQVGDWPSDCEDGLTVYEGNGTSTTQTIDTDDLTIGLYYHVYNISEGNCSSCYATGSVIASDSIETGGGNVTINTEGLTDIANTMKLGIIFGFPVLLGLIGAIRHSLTLYLCGVLGLGISLAAVGESLGSAVTIPMFILIVGLLGAIVRDVLNRDYVIV